MKRDTVVRLLQMLGNLTRHHACGFLLDQKSENIQPHRRRERLQADHNPIPLFCRIHK